MRTIQLKVREDTAERIENLSAKEKDKLVQILDIWLKDRRTLREVMNDMSSYAQKQGMTPEILEQILKEE